MTSIASPAVGGGECARVAASGDQHAAVPEQAPARVLAGDRRRRGARPAPAGGAVALRVSGRAHAALNAGLRDPQIVRRGKPHRHHFARDTAAGSCAGIRARGFRGSAHFWLKSSCFSRRGFLRGDFLSRISEWVGHASALKRARLPGWEGQATALKKPAHHDPGRIAEGLVGPTVDILLVLRTSVFRRCQELADCFAELSAPERLAQVPVGAHLERLGHVV